nr:hypothetical protein [Abalone asfa-like virus]
MFSQITIVCQCGLWITFLFNQQKIPDIKVHKNIIQMKGEAPIHAPSIYFPPGIEKYFMLFYYEQIMRTKKSTPAYRVRWFDQCVLHSFEEDIKSNNTQINDRFPFFVQTYYKYPVGYCRDPVTRKWVRYKF